MRDFFVAYVLTVDAIARYNHHFVDKFAHMVVGLVLWLLVAVLARRPVYSLLPFAVIVALESVQETIEALFSPKWTLFDASTDLLATLLFPTLIAAVLKFAPFTRGEGER
jgi:small basic protein